jgi:hypothetical protein
MSVVNELKDIAAVNVDLSAAQSATVRKAAAMLEMFLGQMQIQSPHMSGKHYWLLRSFGWPMRSAVGLHAEEAALAVVAEIERNRTADKLIPKEF